MKKLKRQWLMGTCKVLSAFIALLGVASCSLFRRHLPQPLMYGVPNTQWDTIDTVKPVLPPVKPVEPEYKTMYGVRPTTFQKLNEIDKGGVDIEIRQN